MLAEAGVSKLKWGPQKFGTDQTKFGSTNFWGKARLRVKSEAFVVYDKTKLEARNELAPGTGFEPATNRLTADCSTTELPRNKF